MPINDAHCHFFSRKLFDTLGRQRTPPVEDDAAVIQLTTELGWEAPGTPVDLAARWIGELDRAGVQRAALIASVPGDEESVAEAVKAYPDRLVGLFMLDASATDAVARATRAVTELGLRGICFFPAMHRFRLDDDRVLEIVATAASCPGTVVFAHCGFLSVGVRKKLKLPSTFDVRLGQPLDLQRAAYQYPQVPFIIPHFGAGFFREALMLADLCPNVYFDTSSSNGWIRYHPGLTLSAAFARALDVLGPDRLLFGTDSSFFPRGWQRAVFEKQNAALDELKVDPGSRAKIFTQTFEKLFPIT